MTTNNLGLYIHIPFCRQKCKYCDFLSFPCTSEQVYREYVTALCMEMESRREDCQGREVDTVFIGGGTPSLLQPEDFRRMMDSIRNNFHLAEEAEITIETNPNSISQQKLDADLENGVNRISIGIQSFDNQILHRLGRLHDKNEAFQKIQMVRKSGFTNINIDLMFGIPEQAMRPGWTPSGRGSSWDPSTFPSTACSWRREPLFIKKSTKTKCSLRHRRSSTGRCTMRRSPF